MLTTVPLWLMKTSRLLVLTLLLAIWLPGVRTLAVSAAPPVAGPAVPAAPTNLTATPDNGLVTLTWTASAAPPAAYYYVYESTNANAAPSAYTNIGTAYGTTFTQSGLVNGTTYYYYLIAHNDVGASTASNTAHALVSLAPATGLTPTPGNGSISLTWTASPGSGVTSYNVYGKPTASSAAYTLLGTATGTSYTQTSLVNGTSYSYYVVPINNGGLGTASATASALVSLPAPTNLQATAGNGSITVTWTASAAPGAADYNVYGSSDPNAASAAYTLLATVAGTSYTQNGLNNGSTYYYYLVPVNDGGAGTPSAKTSALVSLPAPTNVHAAAGNGAITVTWDASGAPGAASYSIFQSATLGGTYTNIGYVPATAATSYSYTQNGLSNGKTYYYYVVASNNGIASPNSATTSALVSLPAPTGLKLTTGSGTITLDWTASAAPGASYYQVYRAVGTSTTFTVVGTSYNTTFLQTGLSSATTYTYYLVPFNNGGAGTTSAKVSTQSVGAASALSATPGNGSITLNWSAVSGATSYNIYRSTDSANFYYQDNTSNTTYTQGGLSNGSTYYYYYVPVGAGTQSFTVSATVVLPPPTNLAAATGDGTITLTWTASAAPGATQYNIYRSTDGANFYYQDNTSNTTYTQAGLGNGSTYYYFLVPYNNGGAGTQSSTVSATLGLPPPTNLTATPGAGTITLTWTASASPKATSYSILRSTDGVNFYYQDNTSNTTYTQSGLSNGTTYYYFLVPYNGGGAGTASSTVSALVSLPPPTNLTGIPGDGIVTLTWTASAPPGATSYKIFRSTDGANFYYQDSTSSTSYTQAGLGNAVTYEYYLVPNNAGGDGNASATIAIPIALPAPTNLTATSGDGSITLNWTASAAPGASSYKILESTDGANFYYQDAVSGTTYTQTGRTNGTTYYFYLIPVNNGGEGIHSSVVSTQVNLPPPTNLTATLGDGSVTLNWTASAAPGATSYKIFRSTDGANFYYQDVTSDTNYTQTGLNNGTSYYYYLVPQNSGGVGTQSVTVSALVGLPPPTNLKATPGDGSITLTWTASAAPGAGSYNIYRSTDGANFYYQDNTSSTTYTQTGLTNGTTYYYYLVPVNNGSVGTRSATVSATPGLAAPTNLTATPGNNSIVLNWMAPTTPGATGYHVYQSTALNGAYTLVGSPTATTYTDSGLLAGTTYYYYVTAYNTGNESPRSNSASATTLGADITPPATSITTGPAEGGLVCSVGTAFTFTGSDNRTPTASLLYTYKLDTGNFSTPNAATTATFPALADGAHTFTVKAIDQAGNIDPNGVTRHFTVSSLAPVISSVTTGAPSATGVTITWTTDKAATSQVDYRITGTTTFTSTALDGNLVTGHAVTLSGLTLGKSYDYRVRSADGCGHTTVSAIQTFTTTPDTTAPDTSITTGPAEGGTACDTTATFGFIGTDNVTTASALRYQYRLDSAAFSAPTMATTAALTGLTEGAHEFDVAAVDAAGNVDGSPAVRHFTVSLATPVISAIGTAPLDLRATITWTTDTPTTSQVEFGKTTAYGSLTTLDTTLTTAHSVSVTGLTASTLYHFRVRSKNACREAIGADGTFTTTVPLKPNLEVTGLNFPTPVHAGDTLGVSWNVTNVGPGDANGAWSDALYLSTSGTIDANAVLLGTYAAPNSLLGGSQYGQSQSIALSSTLAPGTYYLILKTDSANAVVESSELDNTLAQRLEISKIQTLIVTPDQNAISLTVGNPIIGTLNLGNLGTVGKTGLKATVTGVPANITVQVSVPTTLAGMTGNTATVTVTATSDVVQSVSPVIHFTDDQGDDSTATLNLTVAPNRPNLVANPSRVSTGMVRGKQTLVPITVTNTGSAAATNLTVVLPTAPWLSLTTPATLGDLAPGASAQVILSLTPDATLPLGLYNGTIGVNGDNAGLTIAATFNCISSAKGDLKVTSTDEFTYFASDHPPLAGAQVTVTDAVTGAVVASGVTDATGVYLQTGLPEGSYNLEVTDDKHGTYRTSAKIVAAQETDLTAFLPRQLVTYSWTVVPVDFEDHYQVTLQAVFETHVPAPVVTISPKIVDATALDYDENGEATVYFTITNHGADRRQQHQAELWDRSALLVQGGDHRPGPASCTIHADRAGNGDEDRDRSHG